MTTSPQYFLLRPSILLILLPAMIFSCAAPDEPEIPEKPNILFIAVDDLRPELNCFGVSKIKSPQIDRIAADGIIFERAYCQVPVCGASRASLLTGLRPSRTRFLNYYTWAEKDAPEAISLPEHFKNNGYHTISNGKVFHHRKDMIESWTEEPWRPDQPVNGEVNWRDYQTRENRKIASEHDGAGPAFEEIDAPDSVYFDGKIAAKSVRDLRKLKESGQPFFLAVGFLKPHLPFNAPSRYWDMYSREDIELASNPFPPVDAPEASLHNWGELRQYTNIPPDGPLSVSMARKMVHGYNACVSYTDAQIGKLLDELEALDLHENTVVILWGDHGWNLGEHGLWCKHCNYETSLRAPIVLKVPWEKGNLRTKALVEFIDIYPTLCEIAGLPIPDQVQGESLTRFINNPEATGKPYVYSRFHNGESVKDLGYRYTEWIGEREQRHAEMLYDHVTDHEENYNLSEDPEHEKIIAKFQKLNSQLRENLSK